ncbi:metalloregulator ArsR/SmtB family transcription factor [Rothia nasimurium]|uniref:Metalloregulator ArsR/SmtB family transcription factor n=1 Tax=Luteibacter anthropi TaxID=564369 RepID=A0A7X5UC74_9GAMM|nr:metalloregulator ArsR/SmtB family transcription factor [Luteibacter anthropi]NII07783.1 metalloregulator ArsR/SmtB family transcription factor [Luteibacter anthropi]
MDLSTASTVLRLLADPTRVRLLALLDREELTVAELAAVLHLAQPRVSTHLAKLKEADLVRDRRAGVSAYYRANGEADPTLAALVASLRDTLSDALLREDAERLPAVLAQRARTEGWADTVAGDMERHYSPGRTWETLGRALLQLLETGDVLDIASGDGVTAELLAPHAHSILCIDSSDRVVDAARQRLADFPNVEVRLGDMHALDLGKKRFDLVLLMHALTYSEHPDEVFRQVAGVLKPGGRVLAVTLGEHDHRAVVEPFDHRNLGFSPRSLSALASNAGLDVVSCNRLSRERRAPHFEVISLLARKS